MSVIQKETIEVIAQSIGITNLSPDAALALAPDVEYRLREIMQEAIKCMRHSKRTLLTVDDVDSALKLRNVEPIYGFATGDPLRFRRALGHKDLFYVDDKDVDLKDVIEAPLPKAPLDSSVVCHWLAIEGVQPAIPENAAVEVIGRPQKNNQLEAKETELPVDIRLPVKHVLSRELQLYFDKVAELAISRSDSVLFKEALASLATDSGLHPLVPYFTCFIADEVSHGLGNFSLLFALMRLTCSLLHNPHIDMKSYLHQLMPAIVTCLVSKRLGNRLADNHWELRDFTATLIASICRRYAHVYSTLQTRLTKTFLNGFLDPKRALPQHYGAIQGLAALGSNVVCLLILPNLEAYLRLLEPEMLLEKQKNEIKRLEAWRVYGALLNAAGKCIFDRLKLFPPFPSSLVKSVWKPNSRVAHSPGQYKRKTIEDHTEESPAKKIENDSGADQVSNKSAEMEIDQIQTVGPLVDSSGAGPSSAGETQDDSSKPKRRQMLNKQVLHNPALLKQVWKDDLDSGRLLAKMFELFGDSIFPFIPVPEMAMFL